MPQLTKQTEDFRKLQALETIRLMSLGVKKSQACQQTGLTIRQFDYWMARDEGAIEAFQEAIIETERIRLVQITNAQAIFLQELINQATQPGMRAETLLKVLKYLDTIRKELEEKLGVNTETDKAGDYLIKMVGPATRVETSMMVTALVITNNGGSANPHA